MSRFFYLGPRLHLCLLDAIFGNMAAEPSNMEEPATIIATNQAQTTDSGKRNALKEAVEHFSLTFNADLFLVAARQSFEEDNASTVLEILQDPKHRDLLNFVGWDLVKIVFQFLPNENTESEYRNILVLICNICNPREICFSLGELLSFSITWPKFIILIGLFQLVCQRLKGKVAKIFSSILSSLTRCLTTRENKFDHLPEILEKILEFLKPQVEKTYRGCSGAQLSESPTCEDIEELKNVLKLFFIGLLEFPLVAIDILASPQPDIPKIDSNVNCVTFREIAKTIVEYLGHIECNSFKHLFEYGINLKKQMKKYPGSTDSDSSDEESSRLSYLGVGCLAFLVLVEGIGSSFLPVVITGKRSLETILVYIIPMLTTGQSKIISKGLKLLMAILNMIEPATLDHRLLKDGELSNSGSILTQLMTHCEDADIRRNAAQGLRRIFNRLARRGRYGLLRSLHQGCVHSGVAELLVLILKEEIAKSLQEDVDNQWFVGSNIADFLLEVFRVPTKVLQSEDGMVEERNRILSSLNLLRFLLIRDHGNKTGVHTMASEVERSYLKPLTDAVSLSKVRLKVLMKEKRDEMTEERPVEVCDEIFSVITPDGRELEKGSLQDQLQSLQFANLTVDMIDSVLARIREICAEKRKEKE